VPCCGPTATGHDGRRGSSRWHHHPRPGRPAETSGRPTCWSAAGRSSHNVTYAGVRPGSVPNRPISVAGMIPPSPAGPGASANGDGRCAGTDQTSADPSSRL